MKTQFSEAILTAIFCLIASMLYAQPFQQIGGLNDWETQSSLDKVGIGDFPVGSPPQSALHIDGSLVNTPTGDVFRTNATGATYWKMFRNVSGTPTEFGRIFNNNDNHFYFQANNGSGDLRFNTGGSSTNRMRIDYGGNVGIGSDYTAGATTILDIEPAVTNSGYGINGSTVLHNWGLQNIFVGLVSGFNNTTGTHNTFAGAAAGFSNLDGEYNVFVGSNAGYTNQSMSHNTYVGTWAGQLVENEKNTFIGSTAGYTSAGDNNSFLGYAAGNQNDGKCNTFIGNFSGFANVGNYNVAVGENTGTNNVGHYNSILGWQTGTNNTGDYNVLVGNAAGQGNSGSNNVLIGKDAGFSNTGASNSFCGYYSGRNNTSGNSNTFLGFNSGLSNTSGIGNTFIGYGAQGSVGNLSNSSAIGANATVTTVNSMILGDNNINVGIGLSSATSGPQNKLEIDAGLNGQAAVGSGVAGASGLQFRDLHSGTTAGTNTTGKVLSVNTVGEVILVNDIVGPGTVSACTTGTNVNRLTKWDGTNVICNTIVYEDANTRIGISTVAPSAKLHVQNPTESIGTWSWSTGANSSQLGFFGISENAIDQNVGIYAMALPFTDLISGNPPSATTAINKGVVGAGAFSVTENYGGQFVAVGEELSDNYGVWAYAGGGTGNSHAGYFIGDVDATGQVTWSDSMFKDSIEVISGASALATLSQLSPRQYVFKRDSFPYMNFKEGHQFGFIAQEVNSILPELVDSIHNPEVSDTLAGLDIPELDFLGLNYTGLLPLTVSAINSLNELKVESSESATDSNYVTKWSATNKTLTNSIIYDNGTRIGIGTTRPDTTRGTFTVFTTTDSFAVQGYGAVTGARFRGQNAGVGGTATGSADTDMQAGVYGECENALEINAGVFGIAESPTDTAVNAGVIGVGENSDFVNGGVGGFSAQPSATAINYGVAGFAAQAPENRGGYFEVYEEDTASTAVNYAVYATTLQNTDTNFYAGYFEGNLVYTGNLVGPSDAKLKENVTEIADALPRLLQLQPKVYEFKTDEYKSMGLPQGKQFGLLAEETEQVFPELVHRIISPEHRKFNDTSSLAPAPQVHYKGINYMEMIPLLLKGMQEQQAIIDSLAKELGEVKTSVTNCCGSEIQYRNTGTGENTNEEVHELTVELSALQIVILEQNVPNPFNEQTSISYFVPEDAGKATMHFTDLAGRTIKTVELEKGSGIITVFAQHLGSGTYSYSLVVDGKVAETKKMVKAR